MSAAEEYARKVLSSEIVAGKYIKQACNRFMSDLERNDIYFDVVEAERYCDCAEGILCLWEDQWRGKPVKLVLFQKFIIQNIFGWKVVETGKRKYRTAYIQTARKQAKTTLMAIIAWLHLILDESTSTPSILIGANNEKQAKICSNAVGQMALVSPALRTYVDDERIVLGMYSEQYYRVTYRPDDSRMGRLEAISRDPSTKDGFNPSLCIIDEYHEADNDKLLKVMQSGQVTRAQPLLLVITTAGFNKGLPCYTVLRKTGIDILEGNTEMDSRFVLIYERDGEDWEDRDAWVKTNPLMVDVPDIRHSLEELYKTAKVDGGSAEVDFRTKNLNEWVDAPEVWISADILKANSHGITEEELIGKPCFGGLDAAKSLDLNAFALFFPNIRPNIHAVKMMYWIPSDKIDGSDDVADYYGWTKKGYMIKQHGNVIMHEILADDIIDELKKYKVMGIGFDHKYAYQIIAKVVRDGGYPEDIAYSVPQGFGISPHVITLERMIMKKEIDLMDNPVLMWNFGNSQIIMGQRGDRFIGKLHERQKIDGVTALLDAVAEWKRRDVERGISARVVMLD